MVEYELGEEAALSVVGVREQAHLLPTHTRDAGIWNIISRGVAP